MLLPCRERAFCEVLCAPAYEVDEHNARIEICGSLPADPRRLPLRLSLGCGSDGCACEIERPECSHTADAECIGIEVEDAVKALRDKFRHENPREHAAVDPLARDAARKGNRVQRCARVIDVDIRPRKCSEEGFQTFAVGVLNPVTDEMKSDFLPLTLHGSGCHGDARVLHITCVHTECNLATHHFHHSLR